MVEVLSPFWPIPLHQPRYATHRRLHRIQRATTRCSVSSAVGLLLMVVAMVGTLNYDFHQWQQQQEQQQSEDNFKETGLYHFINKLLLAHSGHYNTLLQSGLKQSNAHYRRRHPNYDEDTFGKDCSATTSGYSHHTAMDGQKSRGRRRRSAALQGRRTMHNHNNNNNNKCKTSSPHPPLRAARSGNYDEIASSEPDLHIPDSDNATTQDFEQYIQGERRKRARSVPAEEYLRLVSHHKRLKRYLLSMNSLFQQHPYIVAETRKMGDHQQQQQEREAKELGVPGGFPVLPERIKNLDINSNEDDNDYVRRMDGVDAGISDPTSDLYEDDPNSCFFGESARLSGKRQGLVDLINARLYPLLNDWQRHSLYAKAMRSVVKGKHVLISGAGGQISALYALKYGARKVTFAEDDKELKESLRQCAIENSLHVQKIKFVPEKLETLDDHMDLEGDRVDVFVTHDYGAMLLSDNLHAKLNGVRAVLRSTSNAVIIPSKGVQYVELIQSKYLRQTTSAEDKDDIRLTTFNHYRNTDTMFFTPDFGISPRDLNITQMSRRTPLFSYHLSPIETARVPSKKTITLKLEAKESGFIDAIMVSWDIFFKDDDSNTIHTSSSSSSSSSTHDSHHHHHHHDDYSSAIISTHPHHSNISSRDQAYGVGFQLCEDFDFNNNDDLREEGKGKTQTQTGDYKGITISKHLSSTSGRKGGHTHRHQHYYHRRRSENLPFPFHVKRGEVLLLEVRFSESRDDMRFRLRRGNKATNVAKLAAPTEEREEGPTTTKTTEASVSGLLTNSSITTPTKLWGINLPELPENMKEHNTQRHNIDEYLKIKRSRDQPLTTTMNMEVERNGRQGYSQEEEREEEEEGGEGGIASAAAARMIPKINKNEKKGERAPQQQQQMMMKLDSIPYDDSAACDQSQNDEISGLCTVVDASSSISDEDYEDNDDDYDDDDNDENNDLQGCCH